MSSAPRWPGETDSLTVPTESVRVSLNETSAR